jgi:hypothetical protein
MTTFAASCGECIHKGFKEKPFDPNYRKRECFAARPSLEELFAGVSDKAPHNGRSIRLCEFITIHSER